jgi:hypothetical protein
MTGAAIDTGALLKMFYSSLLAGVGVAVIFSIAILGAVRATDMRRANRSGAAAAYGALAALGLVLTTAVIVYGLLLVARKA